MKTLATKQMTNDSAKQKKKGNRGRSACSSAETRLSRTLSRSVFPLSTGIPLLQRKCTCGGGCPRCQEDLGIQTKLKIGEPGDKYEQEADRIADEVMRMPEPTIQRQVTSEEEEEKIVQRKAISGLVSSSSQNQSELNVPPIVHEVLSSPGEALEPKTRTLMESRFDCDFSRVRIHKDAEASQSAQAIDAMAYSLDQHIVFDNKQYTPKTISGQRLLAHELVHTLQNSISPDTKPELLKLSSTSDPTEQQANRIAKAVIQYSSKIPVIQTGQPNKIQRMKIGEGKPPLWETEEGNAQLEKISEKEAATVNAAIQLVKAVAHDQEQFSNCHDFFTENCPNGDSLKNTFDRAVLWKFPPDAEETGGARAIAGKKDIAITYLGFRADATTLAHYLMHELMHICGIRGSALHRLADKARLYCMGTDPTQLSLYLTKGATIGALLSYRRVLEAWVLGRLKPSVGLDFNLAGATDSGGDLLSVMGGLKGRYSALWGGEQFGGLTLSPELGLGVGRFREMTEVERAKTGFDAGLVLQLKVGAEFAIPEFLKSSSVTEGRARPISLEAAYRIVKPLTSQAESLHSLLFGISTYF